MTVCLSLQAVEELLESLELEKSSYHMGLSRVSNTHTHTHTNTQVTIHFITSEASKDAGESNFELYAADMSSVCFSVYYCVVCRLNARNSHLGVSCFVCLCLSWFFMPS